MCKTPKDLARRNELAKKKGTIKRLHVDQAVIRRNRDTGSNDAPLTIQTSAGPLKAHRVSILGSCELINSPHQPLPCGARVYIQTKAALAYE